MEYLSSDKIGIIDLGNSEVLEEALDDELVSERIGGAGISTALYERYKEEEPIVLGTGLLTGTLVPGSALGIITAKSPTTGSLCHAPFTLYAGVELKYSGFDYLVIKGRAEKPVYLWIHDGIVDIEDATELWGKDTWVCTDNVRNKMGDDVIQTLVIGRAGEEGSDFSQLINNFWGSGDRWAFGSLFGSKNLKLLAIRGMGLLEIADPEGFVSSCKELLAEVKKGPYFGKAGIGEIMAAMGQEDVTEWIGPLVHRHRSCFNTPVPTSSFVFLDEDPKLLTESEKEEPGFLLTDVVALSAFKQMGLSGQQVCHVMKECAREGLDPLKVAHACQSSGKTGFEVIMGSLKDLKGEIDIEGVDTPFSPWCPQGPLFGDFGLSGQEETKKWWIRRQAIAYIFGIHPIFAIMAPELSEERLLNLAKIGTEIEFDTDTLDKLVDEIC